MEVRAVTKYIRISPQKARLVADMVRGQSAVVSLNKLKFVQKKAAGIIAKVLRSAIANAEHNYSLEKDALVISEILVDEGPTLKRIRPRARGTAFGIKKRTSHIKIVLTAEEKPKKKIAKEVPKEKVIEKKSTVKKVKEEK